MFQHTARDRYSHPLDLSYLNILGFLSYHDYMTALILKLAFILPLAHVGLRPGLHSFPPILEAS